MKLELPESLHKTKEKRPIKQEAAESMLPSLIYVPFQRTIIVFKLIFQLSFLRKRRDNLSAFKKKVSPKGKESAPSK